MRRAVVSTFFSMAPGLPCRFSPQLVCSSCSYCLTLWYRSSSYSRLFRRSPCHLYQQRTGGHLYVQDAESRRLEYSRDTLLTPEPAKDVRLYRLASFFRQRYGEIFDRTMGSLDRMRRRLAISATLASVLVGMATGAVYLYVIWLIVNGEGSIGDLALYGGAAVLLQATLPMLGFDVGYLSTLAFTFLPSLYRVIETPPDLAVPENPTPAPKPIREGIVFERVSFSYPGTPDRFFTTCLSPSAGRMPGVGRTQRRRQDDDRQAAVAALRSIGRPNPARRVDLREYDLEGLRREIGAVFQDFVRFELTAGQNIGLGDVQAIRDSERIRAAASKAGAVELLENLPDGPDTWIGREFGGRELSGGEWQKLALARAFMRDSQLLVLDEPTANLDVQTEYEIYLRFGRLTRDCTTLLISHRFSTVRMADRIIYLADAGLRKRAAMPISWRSAANTLISTDCNRRATSIAVAYEYREIRTDTARALRCRSRVCASAGRRSPDIPTRFRIGGTAGAIGIRRIPGDWRGHYGHSCNPSALAKFVVDSLADQAATAAFSFAALYTLTLLVPAGAEPIQRALTSWLEARAVAEVDYSLIDNSPDWSTLTISSNQPTRTKSNYCERTPTGRRACSITCIGGRGGCWP